MPGRRYLLDTHVVINIGVGGGLQAMPAKVRKILEDPGSELLVSVVSEAEVAIKSRIGKLNLTKDEWTLICTNACISSFPLRQQHTDRLFDLPLRHKDPFDRLIISTALSEDFAVISNDQEFRKYKGLKVIW